MFPSGRRTRVLVVITFLLIAFRHEARADHPPPTTVLTADQAAALDRITANSLRGHLSFLASDLLEGRATPSRSLDLSAEYIAAQFRRAGLEAIGDDGYFQTANWNLLVPDTKGFAFEVKYGDGTPIRVGQEQLSLQHPSAFDASAVRIFKIDARDAKTWAELTSAQVEGKAVFADVSEVDRGDPPQAVPELMTRMAALKAAVVVNVSRQAVAAAGLAPRRPISSEKERILNAAGAQRPGPPLITVHDTKTLALFDSLPLGASDKAMVSLHLREPVFVRNVLGLLRGSCPSLKDTYVIVTAHYDHIGMRVGAGDQSDQIYNGANDDGSGTVSVIELASALATLKTHPKRSILFMTFFGEEKGLKGSRYYGRHPVVPIEKTVAAINLEQLGRTDDVEGPRVGAATMTGYGYSDVSEIFTAAGQSDGVRVYRHPLYSDSFFGRSDNQALADLGVPAHTIGVAYIFPDYHGVKDHWDRIDYANMAKVDRMVAHGLLMIADDVVEPKWTELNPKAAKYLKAWKARHGQ